MKAAMFLLFSVLLLEGCDMNTRVDFILEDPKIQTENGIDFAVNWRNGVPLYYFNYEHFDIPFVVRIYSDKIISPICVSSYSIRADELGIDFYETDLSLALDMQENFQHEKEDSQNEGKTYYGAQTIKIQRSFMPDTMRNQKDLVLFRKAKHVFLTVTIDYTIDGQQKSSTITWKFKPLVRKSSALLDKWMSV